MRCGWEIRAPMGDLLRAAPITALFAAPLALLFATLGAVLSLRRLRSGIGPAMQGDKAFLRLQRVHGNFAEHVPLLLLLLYLRESLGAPATLLWAMGGTLWVARACHALGLLLRV